MRNIYFDHPDNGETVYGKVKGKALFRESEDWDYNPVREHYIVPDSVIAACVDADIEEIVLNRSGWRRVIYVDDLLDYGQSDWKMGQDVTGIPESWVGH